MVAIDHVLDGVQKLLNGLDVDQLLQVAGVLLEPGLSQALRLLSLFLKEF